MIRTDLGVVDGVCVEASGGGRPAQVQAAVVLRDLLAGEVLGQGGKGARHGGVAVCNEKAIQGLKPENKATHSPSGLRPPGRGTEIRLLCWQVVSAKAATEHHKP